MPCARATVKYDAHGCESFYISQHSICMEKHMNLELRQLRYFVSPSPRSCTSAAPPRLHMTQPPLSQTIMALEEQLGAPTPVRAHAPRGPADAGRRLAARGAPAAGAGAGAARAGAPRRAGRGGASELRLVSSADYSVLPPPAARVPDGLSAGADRPAGSHLDLQLDELLAGRTDAGLLIPPLPEGEGAELTTCPYWPSRWCWPRRPASPS